MVYKFMGLRQTFVFIFLFSFLRIYLQTSFARTLENNRILLPNGWSLMLVGKSLLLGDLLLNMAVSKSKKYMALTNNVQSTQSL
jgi:hypothetical protein